MKKKTIDLITTGMALIFFAFGFFAFWFDKMNGWMLALVVVVSIGLVTFKNEKLEKFIDKLLSIFSKK